MKRYYKREAESALGLGTVYIEFNDEVATRQVAVYGNRWFNSSIPYHQEIGPSLCDQPFSVTGLGPEHEVSSKEFERIWAESTT